MGVLSGGISYENLVIKLLLFTIVMVDWCCWDTITEDGAMLIKSWVVDFCSDYGPGGGGLGMG